MSSPEPILQPIDELFPPDVKDAFSKNIFDFFPNIIYVYNAETKKIRYVNKKVSDFLGFLQEGLLENEHVLTHLIYPEDTTAVQQEIEKFTTLKDNESHSYACRFNTTVGGQLPFQVTGRILNRNEAGAPHSLLFIAQDISAQVKATEELKSINALIKEKEELMRDYQERVDLKEEFLECGSWKIDMPDKIFHWSDGMYRLFGYDPKTDKDSITVNEELYLQHMTDVTFKKAEQFRTSVLKDQDNYKREYEIITKSGERRRIETFAKIVRGQNGEVVRVLGTTRNITEIRNTERETEQNINKLKTSVNNLEAFTYTASHDIQEPLRKIATFSERMKTKFAEDLNDEAKTYLDKISGTSKSANLLIDGLMSFLLLDQREQHFKKTDLNTLLEEAKIELELRLEEAAATIIAKKLPVLEVIPLQIKQLLVNLLLNAFKFRKPGTLLVIEIESTKLTPAEEETYSLPAGVDYYKILVRDNGIGFSEAAAEKMFQMFQRFHNKSDYPGAGIGLAICKKIVDKHNGLLFAHSQPGQGAIFTFILPAKQNDRVNA